MDWFKFWRRSKPPAPGRRAARIPEGEVIYAIGDVHGRADLLYALFQQIRADILANPAAKIRLVALGDYVDRGPESKEVVEMLSAVTIRSGGRLIALMGNHEAAMLDFLDHPESGGLWAVNGGLETLMSYGVAAPRSGEDEAAWIVARDQFREALPETHLAFLRGLQLTATIGDYLFVHAGLRPRVALDRQTPRDLLWIRQDFLEAPPWGEQLIVHGHTPELGPVERPGRIGIDTGAYATGVLTALRLEADQRRYIQTGEPKDGT